MFQGQIPWKAHITFVYSVDISMQCTSDHQTKIAELNSRQRASPCHVHIQFHQPRACAACGSLYGPLQSWYTRASYTVSVIRVEYQKYHYLSCKYKEKIISFYLKSSPKLNLHDLAAIKQCFSVLQICNNPCNTRA